MTLYLDHNATTPLDPRVQAEINRCFNEEYGNAGSPHAFGLRAKQIVHRARDRIGGIVNARRHEVVFTSGATESNNLAILGLAEYGLKTGKRHIVSTRIEHKAVLEPLAALGERGFEVTLIPPDRNGRISAQELLQAVRPETLLISVMHVNNETGVIQPIEEIASGLQDRRDIFLHVDAAQGFGKEPSGIGHERIDLISVSSHKLNGPVGVGALIARRRGTECVPLTPLMYGGGQELGLRPGTLPVALISGFGLAVELASSEQQSRRNACLTIRERILSRLAPLNPTLYGDPAHSLPHVACLAFSGWDADTLIEDLGEIAAVSTGAACTSVCATASHVLAAMRVPQPDLDGAVRFSWSHLTDLSQIDPTMDQIVARLSKQPAPR